MATTSLRAIKTALRKGLRTRLAQVTHQSIQRQSALVTTQLLALPQYEQATNVCVYINMDAEIITRAIIEDIFAKQKRCFIPRCTPTTMDMVLLRDMADYDTLPRNKWNIPEPLPTDVRDNVFDYGGPHLIIMPGLAFDTNKNRLGHGKGYYDKYIKRCLEYSEQQGNQPPYLVALALNEQIVSEPLPCNEFDEKPHQIISSERVLQ
ncbi:hypothetical protein IWQ62_001099 [Dispira parvispora]|uniref:5-formyltetrahydrofolate cyclo-ligase n=1 Tax=Dispira parvispora TaxID=1520584 RepID=A0A9W8E8K0_9FUNG|nr:hypothetical protein IWQ62_001099 [Dispira parvispora]